MLLDFNQIVNTHNVKIRGCIHVGAYVGEEYITYLNHNIEHIIFFEPQNKIFEILRSNISQHHRPSTKVILVNKALGNKNQNNEYC